MIIPLIGIIVSVLLLIFLAYRGWSVIIAAPLAAVVAMLFSGAPLLGGYTEIFMPALGNFAANYLPIFLTGAIFGQLMTVTGYAERIAQLLTNALGPKFAILATVLSTAILTYGGVSSFVVVFAAYPLARALFREADIPRRLIPATLMLGLATFTMSAIPGSPQVQNIIPTQFFGTTTFAAPLLGIIGGTLIFLLGMAWLEYRAKSLKAKGESFNVFAGSTASGASGASSEPETRNPIGSGEELEVAEKLHSKHLVETSAWKPFVPLIVVIVMNYVSVTWLIPAMNTDYLSTALYREKTVAQVSGTWGVIIAMLVAILVIYLLNLRNARLLFGALAEGAKNATLPLVTTGSEVGYGAIISSLAVFSVLQDNVFELFPNALVSSVVVTAVISGITASATGGVTITLNSFGPQLIEMANQQGISLEVMHRLTAMAAGSFDTLPHNGAVIVVLLVAGLTHRQSYKDIAAVTVVVPLSVVALMIPLSMVLY
ncbi:GntP family permease [Corynebacterium sp. S7]